MEAKGEKITKTKILPVIAILMSGVFLAQPGGGQEGVRPKDASPAGAPYDPQKKIPPPP